MSNDDFLKRAKDDSSISFLSETKLIELLQNLKKAIILSSDSLDAIQIAYSEVKKAIEAQRTSLMVHYHVKNDCSFTQKNLTSSSDSEVSVLNIAKEACGSGYMGFVFVVYNGFQCLVHNGKYSEEVESCFMRTETSKKKLGVLSPVSALPTVFGFFMVECAQGRFIDECFGADGLIKDSILEQSLRNILLHYLREKMQGHVQSEFCTDFVNDEESVDIYINDGRESAIIEVKFAFANNYYAGKTFYRVADRAKTGYEQLNKYTLHLAKDNRRIEYGYLYIFHMLDETEEDIIMSVNSVYKELENELSKELLSVYSETIYNNMHKWKA